MKRKLLLSCLATAFSVAMYAQQTVWNGPVSTSYSGGNGTENDPFEISTAADLARLAKDVNTGMSYENVYFELTSDIVLNSGVLTADGSLTPDSMNLVQWIPVGDAIDGAARFSGYFDGNGHEVKGLYINDPARKNAALFGYSKGKISNLGVTDGYVFALENAAGIVADNTGDITSGYNTCVVKGSKYAGGITSTSYGNLNGCYNKGTVNGLNAAGIVAFSYDKIANCYNLGDIYAVESGAGIYAIDDYINATNTYRIIRNCYNKGDIYSSKIAAGITCSLYTSGLDSCYNEGYIEGGNMAAGIVAQVVVRYAYAYVTACHNSGDVRNKGDYFYYQPSVAGIAAVLLNGNIGISNCYNSGDIDGVGYIAGLAAYSQAPIANVVSSFNTGNVTGDGYIAAISVMLGDESISRCCYLKTSDSLYAVPGRDLYNRAVGCTAEEFSNGCVTWFLNGKTSQINGRGWYQNLDKQGVEKDPMPVLDMTHATVYAEGNCVNDITSYTNTVTVLPDHKDEGNGICVYCNYVIPHKPVIENSTCKISDRNELFWLAGYFNGTLSDRENIPSIDTVLIVSDIKINDKVLNDDLTLVDDSASLVSWIPIESLNASYFDGMGHTISGIYCNNPEIYNQAFLNDVRCNDFRRLILDDCYFRAPGYAAALTRYTYSHVSDCMVKNTRVIAGECASGLIGVVNNRKVSGCLFTGRVDNESGTYGGMISDYYSDNCFSNCYYISRGGNITTGFTLEDVPGAAEATDEESMLSGKLTWLLNGGKTEDISWYQNVDLGDTDVQPVLDSTHNVVYPVYLCPDVIGRYSNTMTEMVEKHELDENGLCMHCGKYELKEPVYANDAYQISTAGELYWFAEMLEGNLVEQGVEQKKDAKAVLLNDIRLNYLTFTEDSTGVKVDGAVNAWTPIRIFAGEFDGCGHSIKGLYVDENGYAGFMGSIGFAFKVRNLTIAESYICGTSSAGAIAAVSLKTDSEITNCHNRSYIIGSRYVGGIIGDSKSILKECSNTGTVQGENYVGGIAGESNEEISMCYNAGTVRGENYVAGISFYTSSSGCVLRNSYNTGDVYGKNYVSGIAVILRPTRSPMIEYCYNTGRVYGDTNIGEIVGRVLSSYDDVTNCYYISSETSVGGISGTDIPGHAEGRTAEEFADGTVLGLLNAGDNAGVWTQNIGVDSCPLLDVFISTGIENPDAISDKEKEYVDVYTVSGILIRKNVHAKEALNGLDEGLYIVGGKKIYINE